MSLSDVFRELRATYAAGVIGPYALGGAVGAAVYIEPAATEDVDVFITIQNQPGSLLISLGPIYDFLRTRGAVVEGERLLVGGWQLQLLPPASPLVEDAVANAIENEVDGAVVPVMTAEHLAAIALETGRLKDKLRLKDLLQAEGFDRIAFEALVLQFGLTDRWRAAQRFFEENQ